MPLDRSKRAVLREHYSINLNCRKSISKGYFIKGLETGNGYIATSKGGDCLGWQSSELFKC